jgi:TolA-binding protein
VRLSSLTIRAGAIVVLGLIAGCADQSGNMNQLNQNEFALRGMIASDRQEIDALKTELKRTQDEVDELKHGAAAPAASAPADVNDRIAKLESEVNAMQATMPAPGPAPVAGSAAPGPPVAGVPPALGSAAATPTSPSLTPPPHPTTSAPSTVSASPEPSPTWPQDLDQELAASQSSADPGAKIYRKALESMKAGNYPTAIVGFAKVQHSYAKSPLSEPAQYFTANAFYESGKYEQAILQFNDLTMRFPSSKFLCESLLREGQSFMRLNDRIDARLTLQKLAGNSNCGTEAVAANNMLRNLGSD